MRRTTREIVRAFAAGKEKVFMEDLVAIAPSRDTDPIYRALEAMGYHDMIGRATGKHCWVLPGVEERERAAVAGSAVSVPVVPVAREPVARQPVKRGKRKTLAERYPPLPAPTSEAERLADAANTCAYLVGGGLCGKPRHLYAGWQHEHIDRYCSEHMKMVAPKRFRQRRY